jgi:hypothetical protein
MSSATLTKAQRAQRTLTAQGTLGTHEENVSPASASAPATSAAAADGLQPWQFFVLAGLGCATAVTFLVRGQGGTAVVLVGVLMATTVLVGVAALRTLRPLVSSEDDRVAMIGQRTRAALEREKLLTLRAIKDLEFDRAMGKLAESDFVEMSGRLRARAGRLMRQLDEGSGYRDQIERDLAKRLGERAAKPPAALEHDASAERHCPACSTANDADARFCKACGRALVTAT